MKTRSYAIEYRRGSTVVGGPPFRREQPADGLGSAHAPRPLVSVGNTSPPRRRQSAARAIAVASGGPIHANHIGLASSSNHSACRANLRRREPLSEHRDAVGPERPCPAQVGPRCRTETEPRFRSNVARTPWRGSDQRTRSTPQGHGASHGPRWRSHRRRMYRSTPGAGGLARRMQGHRTSRCRLAIHPASEDVRPFADRCRDPLSHGRDKRHRPGHRGTTSELRPASRGPLDSSQ
jgi:hypothetical protein